MTHVSPPVIELRVEQVAHLFDPLDPFPIPTRDLARAAEDFIVGWAREAPADAALQLIIHAPPSELAHANPDQIKEAISRHFAARAERVRGDVHELFRVGRISLLIGVGVLGACILGGRLIAESFGETPVTRFFSEGLMILGWVANWRPLEIFLYDWWPLSARRRLLQRIASAPIALNGA